MEPKASEPELGSVIAQAPIFSKVRRSPTQRSFWSMVPLDMMAAEVSPTDTPMAVTIPGHTLHNSMIGIMVRAAVPPSPSRLALTGGSLPSATAAATERSNSIWRW